MNSKRWTKKDERILREIYPNSKSVREVADRLNRSIHAVRLRAGKLGLRRSNQMIRLAREKARTARHRMLYAEMKNERNKFDKNVADEEKAYIAGIIDGEGCIHINRYKHRLEPILSITNNSEELMMYLHKRIRFNQISFKDRKRRALRGIIRGYRCFELLDLLKSYLIVKSKHAKLIGELWDIRKKRLGKSYLPEELELVSKLKELNKASTEEPKRKLFEVKKGTSTILIPKEELK